MATAASARRTYASPCGTFAIEGDHSVRYVLAAKLVTELAEAVDDRQITRTIARYGRIDSLLLDEHGSLQLDRGGAELLFQILNEREEPSAVAIGSNGAFSV